MVRLHLPFHGSRGLAALVCALVGLSTLGSAIAQDAFPYVAYVVRGDAYVRSGPGQRHYPTQQLPPGFAVEVYRHDAGGWCAIRPPEGSFSWVAAHKVRLVEPNIAEVIDDRVVTRVGSAMSPTRSAVQVLMQRGERVTVAAGGSSDDHNWLRVNPPAGEFRWIAAADLSRQAPLEARPAASSSDDWSQGWGVRSGATSAEPAEVEANVETNVFAHLEQTPGPSPTTTAAAHVPPGNPYDDQVEIVAGSPADLQLAQYESQSPGTMASSTDGATAPRIRFQGASTKPPSYTPQEIPQRLQEMELRLSQIVVEPPEQWQFDQLVLEANSMLQQAESPELRAQLRDLLDRLTRFQQVRDGKARIAQQRSPERQHPVPKLGAPVDPMDEIVSNVRQRVREDFADPSGQTASGDIDEPLYDAVGLLKPVVSRRANAPQYALVDGTGDVVSFITPTPDVNLQPYVGRRIGVNGTRGFMAEFRRAHVTAGRVTPVDAPIRR